MKPEKILKLAIEKAVKKYHILDDGSIFNKKTNKELTPYYDGKRYPYISIYMGKGKSKKINVHRLVAYRFLPNPDNLPQINHKDGDRTNNHIDNLERCTAAYNVSDGFNRGRIIWNKGNASKERIYYYCKKYPRQIFWILTNNDFFFAKAFWGGYCYQCGGHNVKDCKCNYWRTALQQMVLKKEPLKYLARFLK